MACAVKLMTTSIPKSVILLGHEKMAVEISVLIAVFYNAVDCVFDNCRHCFIVLEV